MSSPVKQNLNTETLDRTANVRSKTEIVDKIGQKIYAFLVLLMPSDTSLTAQVTERNNKNKRAIGSACISRLSGILSNEHHLVLDLNFSKIHVNLSTLQL